MRIGIISFAHTHAAGYAAILRDRAGIELLTTDPDAATRPSGESGGRPFAESLGVPYVDTLDELLAWRPDAVVICSENARHADYAVRAAEAGAHVLCEKPLATTLDDAHRILDACDAAGVKLMTAFPVRFTAEYGQLRERLARGELGEVLTISGANNGKLPVERAWFADPELAGGGAVADHTVHIADLVFGLFPDAEVEQVYAVANHLLKPDREAETAGLVSIRYATGLTVVIDCSWAVPDSYPTWGGLSIRVVGEKGVAELAPFAPRVAGFAESTRSPLWLSYGQDLDAAMIDEFLDAIEEDRQPIPSGRDGLRALEIVLAAYASIDSGAPATIAATG